MREVKTQEQVAVKVVQMSTYLKVVMMSVKKRYNKNRNHFLLLEPN